MAGSTAGEGWAAMAIEADPLRPPQPGAAAANYDQRSVRKASAQRQTGIRRVRAAGLAIHKLEQRTKKGGSGDHVGI
jgi:hypothetical protein